MTIKRGRAGAGGILERMQIEADAVEHYPAVSVNFPDEPSFGRNPGWPRVELTEEEAADLRRVRDEWSAWEARLLAAVDPEAGLGVS